MCSIPHVVGLSTNRVVVTFHGMDVQAVHRTEKDVEAVCHRKSALPLEHTEGKGLKAVFLLEDIPPETDVVENGFQHLRHKGTTYSAKQKSFKRVSCKKSFFNSCDTRLTRLMPFLAKCLMGSGGCFWR